MGLEYNDIAPAVVSYIQWCTRTAHEHIDSIAEAEPEGQGFGDFLPVVEDAARYTHILCEEPIDPRKIIEPVCYYIEEMIGGVEYELTRNGPSQTLFAKYSGKLEEAARIMRLMANALEDSNKKDGAEDEPQP